MSHTQPPNIPSRLQLDLFAVSSPSIAPATDVISLPMIQGALLKVSPPLAPAIDRPAPPPPSSSSPWARDDVADRLKQLLHEGAHTGTAIAAILNEEFSLSPAITRSAVIGKAFRLGIKMAARASEPRTAKNRAPRRPRTVSAGQAPAKLKAPRIPADPPAPSAGSLSALSSAYNRWCIELGEKAVDPNNLVEISAETPFQAPAEIRNIDFKATPPVPWRTFERCQCKYIVTDVLGSGAMVCGNPRRMHNGAFTSPYCEFHAQVCSDTAARPRKRPSSSEMEKDL